MFIHICEYSALPLSVREIAPRSVEDTVHVSAASGAAPRDLRNQNSFEPWSRRAREDMDARRGEVSVAASELQTDARHLCQNGPSRMTPTYCSKRLRQRTHLGECHLWSVPPVIILGVRTRSAVGAHGLSVAGAARRSRGFRGPECPYGVADGTISAGRPAQREFSSRSCHLAPVIVWLAVKTG